MTIIESNINTISKMLSYTVEVKVRLWSRITQLEIEHGVAHEKEELLMKKFGETKGRLSKMDDLEVILWMHLANLHAKYTAMQT